MKKNYNENFRKSVRNDMVKVVKTLSRVGGIAAVAMLRGVRIGAYAAADSCTLILKELRKR